MDGSITKQHLIVSYAVPDVHCSRYMSFFLSLVAFASMLFWNDVMKLQYSRGSPLKTVSSFCGSANPCLIVTATFSMNCWDHIESPRTFWAGAAEERNGKLWDSRAFGLNLDSGFCSLTRSSGSPLLGIPANGSFLRVPFDQYGWSKVSDNSASAGSSPLTTCLAVLFSELHFQPPVLLPLILFLPPSTTTLFVFTYTSL